MVNNDIYLRGALIISTLILVSILAGYMVSSLDDADHHTIERYFKELQETILRISKMEVGSSVILSIDDMTDGGHTLISVLPGSLIAENSGMRSVLYADEGIIPAHPPSFHDSLNENLSRNIGSIAGGYKIETPAELNFTIVSTTGTSHLYIHSKEMVNFNLSEEIEAFLGSKFVPETGWNTELQLDMEPSCILCDRGFILVRGYSEIINDGFCPIPVLLQRTVFYDLEFQNGLHSGFLNIIRYSSETSNGIFKELVLIHDDDHHDLSS